MTAPLQSDVPHLQWITPGLQRTFRVSSGSCARNLNPRRFVISGRHNLVKVSCKVLQLLFAQGLYIVSHQTLPSTGSCGTLASSKPPAIFPEMVSGVQHAYPSR
jgi:hypothetical protein